MLLLLTIILGSLIASLCAKNPEASATAGILLLNWAINTFLAWLSGDAFPWLMFLVTDYLSGLTLLLIRRSHWQTSVIMIYVSEIICHAAYGYSGGGPWPQYHYWYALYYQALAQALIVGVWLVHERSRGRAGNWVRSAFGAPRHDTSARETEK